MLELEVLEGPWGPRRVFEIRDGCPTTVGAARGGVADIQIATPLISRRQAVIEGESDGWWIEDLKSITGTYVNGARVSPSGDRHRISDGDELRLGGVRCVVRIRW